MNSAVSRGKTKARRCALQALYQWQLAGQHPDEIRAEFIAEREMGKADLPYFELLTTSIPRHYEELLDTLVTVIDRPVERLDPVEKTVLLIAAYELEYCSQVPWRVIINEAVELAKLFGAEQGHRFVNGTLDKLAKTLRANEK